MLTEHRISSLKNRPLNISEFIGPLSLTQHVDADTYTKYKDFYHEWSGDKDMVKKMKAAENPDAATDEKKAKGKGKKKK